MTDTTDRIYFVHDLKPQSAISQAIWHFVLPFDNLNSMKCNLFSNKADSSTLNLVDRCGIYSALLVIVIFFKIKDNHFSFFFSSLASHMWRVGRRGDSFSLSSLNSWLWRWASRLFCRTSSFFCCFSHSSWHCARAFAVSSLSSCARSASNACSLVWLDSSATRLSVPSCSWRNLRTNGETTSRRQDTCACQCSSDGWWGVWKKTGKPFVFIETDYVHPSLPVGFEHAHRYHTHLSTWSFQIIQMLTGRPKMTTGKWHRVTLFIFHDNSWTSF